MAVETKQTNKTGTVVDRLNQNLADQTVVYIKLRNYHWNVTGWEFFRLHELTEEYYNAFASSIDETAEHIRQLGSTPLSTMEEYLEHTQLDEDPETDVDAKTMCKRLKSDFIHLRDDYKELVEIAEDADEPSIADWATERIDWFNQTIWMISSFAEV